MKPQGLPRRLRIRRRQDFLRVQRRGEKHHTRQFLVFVAMAPVREGPKTLGAPRKRSPGSGRISCLKAEGSAGSVRPDAGAAQPEANDETHPRVCVVGADKNARPTRIGVTVTRKVGRAHERNRIKRLVREAFRHERAHFVDGHDMVWVAKRNVGEFSLHDLREDFRALAQRLRRRRGSGRSR